MNYDSWLYKYARNKEYGTGGMLNAIYIETVLPSPLNLASNLANSSSATTSSAPRTYVRERKKRVRRSTEMERWGSNLPVRLPSPLQVMNYEIVSNPKGFEHNWRKKGRTRNVMHQHSLDTTLQRHCTRTTSPTTTFQR
jgi:hypothetical protein